MKFRTKFTSSHKAPAPGSATNERRQEFGLLQFSEFVYGYIEWLKIAIFVDLDLCNRMPLPICDHLGHVSHTEIGVFQCEHLSCRFSHHGTVSVLFFEEGTRKPFDCQRLKHNICTSKSSWCLSAKLVPLMSRISFPAFQVFRFSMLARYCFRRDDLYGMFRSTWAFDSPGVNMGQF